MWLILNTSFSKIIFDLYSNISNICVLLSIIFHLFLLLFIFNFSSYVYIFLVEKFIKNKRWISNIKFIFKI